MTVMLGAACLTSMTGCATTENLPLLFGQSHTVGISIGAAAGEQGADFTLGYKDKNVAVVPVALPTSPGAFAQVGSMSGEKFEDALSVLGQFSVTSGTTQGNVSLGKFFATGAAAKALADGFSAQLGGTAVAPQEKPKSAETPGTEATEEKVASEKKVASQR
jgi:hypothetical protein